MTILDSMVFSDNGMWLTQEPPRRFSFQLQSHVLDYMYGWRNLDAYLFGLRFESELNFRKAHSGIMNAVIYFVDSSGDLYYLVPRPVCWFRDSVPIGSL